MKLNILKIAITLLFLFAIISLSAKTESNAFLYHNVKSYDNAISTTYFKGDGNSKNLIPFKKKVKTLDEHGACVSKVTYVFDMDSKSWKLSNKMVYTYNEGKLVSIEHSDWDEVNNIWDEPQKSSFTYAEDGTAKVN